MCSGPRTPTVARYAHLTVPTTVAVAGNGGFMAQAALLHPPLRSMLRQWVHSDFSSSALDYAVTLFSEDELLANVSHNVDAAHARRQRQPIPARRPWPTRQPWRRRIRALGGDVRVKIRHEDITRATATEFRRFDTFVTISLEHIEDDLRLIHLMPPGSHFVFGTAGFNVEGEHARWFAAEQQLAQYYGNLLTLERIVRLESNRTRLVRGKKSVRVAGVDVKWAVLGTRRYGPSQVATKRSSSWPACTRKLVWQLANGHSTGPASWAVTAPLPKRQKLPSAQDPFVFFHLRKTAGSALRKELAHSASSHRLSFFIPCTEGIGSSTSNLVRQLVPWSKNGGDPVDAPHRRHLTSCRFEDLSLLAWDPAGRNASVFGGCFYWDKTMMQLSLLQAWQVVNERPTPQASCLILVREPVARFQSCYEEYFRSGGPSAPIEGGGALPRPLGELSHSEVADVVANFSDVRRGQSCNNEIARWIGPTSDNGGAIQETKRRLARCVVGDMTTRRADTVRVLRHWFPWIHSAGINNGHHSKHMPEGQLPYDTRELILQYNELDAQLYDFAMARFERQLQEVR